MHAHLDDLLPDPPIGFEAPAVTLPPERVDIARERAALLILAAQRGLTPEEAAQGPSWVVLEASCDELELGEGLAWVDLLLDVLAPAPGMSVTDIAANLDAARDRLNAQIPTPAPEPYLTVPEAAQLARCNPATIRRAFAKGTLPAFRRAHRVLLREADVRAWIESAPVQVKAASPPSRMRRGRSQAPGSVAALREMDPGLAR